MAEKQIVVAKKKVEAQYVEMKVPLYSYGCEKKVKKALSHLKGIYSVNVDFYKQKVTVWGICNKFDVLSTIKSKRREARFWNSDHDNDLDPEICHDPDHNPEIVRHKAEEEGEEPSKRTSTSSSHSQYYSSMLLKPSLSLMRSSSFSWRAVKKVFSRSHSF